MNLTQAIEDLLHDHVHPSGYVDNYKASQELVTLICDATSRVGMNDQSFEMFMKSLRSNVQVELDAMDAARRLLYRVSQETA